GPRGPSPPPPAGGAGVPPPRPLSASVEPAPAAGALGRGPGAMRLADPGRYAGAGALLQAELFSGAFQPLGALATVTQTGSRTTYPDLEVPSRWPALTYGPSKAALADDLPEQGPLFLAVLIRPLAGATDLPPAELVLTGRAGRSLLVYLPGLRGAPAEGVRVLVAADGSTYFAPGDGAGRLQLLRQGSLGGLPLARAAAGQALPIPGEWPLRQRRAVALDLCRPERAALLRPGELGLDPERGRFALAPGDPAIGAGELTVSYTEAFAERVGARSFDRRLEREPPATRLVAASGDARPPGPPIPRERIHATLAEALAAAEPGEVIEIVDSATYLSAEPVVIDRADLGSLTVRAAEGQRPCLAFYGADGAPAAASLRVAAPLDALSLSGLLLSGGPLVVEAPVGRLELTGCTLDPLAGGAALVATADPPAGGPPRYLLCRCISGALRLGPGVEHLLVADTVVDRQGGLAIGGPPGEEGAPAPPAQTVQLERATVLGVVRCDVLHASESLLDELAAVDDQQAGSLRFCRYELGSTLPRRYQCLPTDAQAAATPPGARCLPPRFGARRFGRPDYAQLAAATPPELLAASEGEAEIGAFAGARAATRLANQAAKLREFLPAGLDAIVIGET
ncbi:MAG TPA: hypothetical protein PKD53_09895, partial [Chloroflexaceae bacterium]|nr:hypothetical protein [Chloroflexaceae bacterium]